MPLLLLALALFPLPAAAETESETEAAEKETAKEDSAWDKLKIFGSINWAYGETDGIKYRGVTESGTADLRNAALQLRYTVSDQNEFVLQLAHERVGTSPTNQLRDDIDVDWLFWNHTFSDGTRLRLGRVPLPIGFYNEIKDIGTALPFYRPSGNFYGEGTWTSDSVDGLVLSRRLFRIGDWSVTGDLYYGEWKRIENDGSTLTVGEADISDAVGFYSWLESPSGNFRLGVGVNEFEAEGGVFLAPGVTDDERTKYSSLQAGNERLTFRFEISRRDFTGGYWQPYYAELVFRATEKVQIAGIYDVGHLKFVIPFFASFDDTIEEDHGLAVSYELRPNLVLKAEHHWVEGYGQIEDRPLSFFFDPPEEIELFIVGAALTF